MPSELDFWLTFLRSLLYTTCLLPKLITVEIWQKKRFRKTSTSWMKRTQIGKIYAFWCFKNDDYFFILLEHFKRCQKIKNRFSWLLVFTTWQQHCTPHLWLETVDEPVTQPSIHRTLHTYREAKVLQHHTHTARGGYDALPHPHAKKGWRTEICTVMPFFGSVMPEALWTSLWAVTWCERGQREEELSYGKNLCILYYKHGWDTYLTCSADLCKHTSGCSANKSRLYCPLTSAELLIANVTQLQRRASTVDWGSQSLPSWLTAANAPLIYPKTWNTHNHTGTTRHPLFNRKVHGTSCLR